MFITNLPNFDEKKGFLCDLDGTLLDSVNVKKSLFLAGNLWRAWQGSLPYKPDAAKALLALKQRGMQLSLVSDIGDSMWQWYRDSDILNPPLEELFEAIVTGSMVKYKKPDPEAHYLAMEKMKLHPHECVAVGESLKDTIPATKIKGLTTCVIYDPGSEKDHAELKKLTPYLFNNWGEILWKIGHIDKAHGGPNWGNKTGGKMTELHITDESKKLTKTNVNGLITDLSGTLIPDDIWLIAALKTLGSFGVKVDDRKKMYHEFSKYIKGQKFPGDPLVLLGKWLVENYLQSNGKNVTEDQFDQVYESIVGPFMANDIEYQPNAGEFLWDFFYETNNDMALVTTMQEKYIKYLFLNKKVREKCPLESFKWIFADSNMAKSASHVRAIREFSPTARLLLCEDDTKGVTAANKAIEETASQDRVLLCGLNVKDHEKDGLRPQVDLMVNNHNDIKIM